MARPNKLKFSYLLMPLSLFLVLAVITFILWEVMSEAEQERGHLETQVTAEQVKLRLEAWFDTRGAVITQFGEEWGLAGGVDEKEFSDQAQRIIELYPGFQALNFVDPNLTIQTVVPLEGNRPALGRNLHNHPSAGVREAVDRALESKSIQRTPVIQLFQGGPGFATYFPVTTAEGKLLGIINGVFGVDELVDSCLSETRLRANFNFRIQTPDQQLAYIHHESGAEFPTEGVVTLPVRIVAGDWLLDVALSPQGLARAQTPADEFLAGIGLGVSLLLAIILYGYQSRQREIHLGKEQYRLLVENQIDFVFQVDPRGKISYVSPSMNKFLGLAEGNPGQLIAWDIIHEDDWELVKDRVRDLSQPPHQVELEVRLKAADGVQWTSWRGSAFRRDDGKLDGFVWVGRDITQRRELENQLRRSQRLQSVGQLAGGIAHDFNNILQAIQGYLEFVIDDLPEDSPSRTDLNQAQEAADRAAVLVRQLLAFSRRQVLKPVNLDLTQMVEGLLPMVKRMVGPGTPIKFAAQEGLHIIKADQGQMEQIIMNLAINARDAVGTNGRITIKMSNENLDEFFCGQHSEIQPGPHVKIEFMDNGAGMSKEIMENLFEPFFTTKDQGSGTGLGLATVYGITKQHGGTILVQSEPDIGSCFTIYLPSAEGHVAPEIKDSLAIDLSGTETVLLAEDESLLRDLAERILVSNGYRVLMAADGQQAWEVFHSQKDIIDLAVFDVVMPRLDGRALAEKVRQVKPNLPIIFVSGYDSDAANGTPDTMAGTRRLAKPYVQNVLLTAVRESLDKPVLNRKQDESP